MSAAPVILDPVVTPISLMVESLAACLCAQILADGITQPCFCGVIPGTDVPADLALGTSCKGNRRNGMAYTRVVLTYPSATVGVQAITPGNASLGQGIDLEIGIYRRFPLQRDGKYPPPEKALEVARLLLADERAMRRAIACCDWVESKDDFVAGQYVPQGPQGGVIGGAIPISAWLP